MCSTLDVVGQKQCCNMEQCTDSSRGDQCARMWIDIAWNEHKDRDAYWQRLNLSGVLKNETGLIAHWQTQSLRYRSRIVCFYYLCIWLAFWHLVCLHFVRWILCCFFKFLILKYGTPLCIDALPFLKPFICDKSSLYLQTVLYSAQYERRSRGATCSENLDGCFQ